MMTPIHKVLAVTLAVQVGLSALTWWPRGDGAVAPRPLIEITDPTALEITGRSAEGSAPEPLRLERTDGAWRLPDLDGYPADPAAVDALLERLAELTVRAPIATLATSHRALEVADDAFTRRVRVTAGGQTVDVYLGAASARSANVRRGDSAEVFSASGVSVWSIGDVARRYYDAAFVEVAPEVVTSLTVTNASGAFTLNREGAGWTSPGTDEPLDPDEVEDLLRRLLSVRMDAPIGREVDPAYGLGAAATVAWTTADGSWRYLVGPVVDGKASVKADDRPHVVSVYDSAVKPAIEATLDALIEGPDLFDLFDDD